MNLGSVCDFGCGKGLTAWHFRNMQNEVRMHLYDPGQKIYESFWNEYLKSARQLDDNSFENGQFDLVYSFFAAEHVPVFGDFIRKGMDALAPNGVFIGCLPDLDQNVGDVIVSDHLRHATLATLGKLIARFVPAGGAYKVWRNAPLRAVFFAVGTSNELEKLSIEDHEIPAASVALDLDAIWPARRGDEIRRAVGGRRVVFWGSSFYAKLLDLTVNLEIDRIVDGNPDFQGKNFKAVSGDVLVVEAPDVLDELNADETAVILCMSSQAAQRLELSVPANVKKMIVRVY